MINWYLQNGKDSDVVISSRIRLARNLADFPFKEKAKTKDLEQVLKTIKEITPSIGYDIKYIELKKTYRSSKEIIDYTNKILGLNHVTAIRRENSKPVIYRSNISNLKKTILDDLNVLSLEYLKMAIIAKDHYIATKLYNTIKNDINVSLINDNTKGINSDLVIIPAYLAKGLEFDCVIIYNDPLSKYKRNEKNLLYVACTRAQHELYIYN